jgi:hypothetical protein
MGKQQDSLQRSGTAITDDRRLEQRIPVELIIEVSGFDCSLRYFTGRTGTCEVSESGCQFRLHMALAPETVVAVRAPCSSGVGSNSKADLFRIVRAWQEPPIDIDRRAGIAATATPQPSEWTSVSVAASRIIVVRRSSPKSLTAQAKVAVL